MQSMHREQNQAQHFNSFDFFRWRNEVKHYDMKELRWKANTTKKEMKKKKNNENVVCLLDSECSCSVCARLMYCFESMFSCAIMFARIFYVCLCVCIWDCKNELKSTSIIQWCDALAQNRLNTINVILLFCSHTLTHIRINVVCGSSINFSNATTPKVVHEIYKCIFSSDSTH